MPANRSHNAAATDALIGQTVGGQYTLQRFLGHGSKARVFLATHRTLHRSVVAHLLSVSWSDDSAAVSRFEEQARALRGFEHPNIAAVIDFGREPGRVFVIGEYVEGQLLTSYIKELGRLSLEAFVPIAAQLLKGLGATHARGLVHADLKPDNVVLVEEQGRANYVKILDLGLAQLLEGPTRGEDGPVVGTAAYMAPEQILNKPVDSRTDVYSLGVIFYQMLAGKLPFEAEGDARSALYKHINDKPAPLKQAVPSDANLPEGLFELVHDCLAKNPDNRPADANEIVERLIDSVPAAMFRLPIAGAAPRAATGDLTRPPTGEFPRTPTPRPEPLQHARALAAAVEASGHHAIPTIDAGTPGAGPTNESRKGGGSAWIFGLLAVVLTGVLVYMYLQPPLTQRPVTGVQPLAPEPAPNLDQLVAEAQAFEQAGKLSEAKAAYARVLTQAPEHPLAQERLAALATAGSDASAGDTPSSDTTPGETAAIADKPAVDPDPSETPPEPTDVKPAEPALVEFAVEANVRAEIQVDGETKGKTPQKLQLAPGPHKFVITAAGYTPHEEQIDVAADGQKTLKVKLVRKPAGTPSVGAGGINRDEENRASANLDPENDAPTTKVEIKR